MGFIRELRAFVKERENSGCPHSDCSPAVRHIDCLQSRLCGRAVHLYLVLATKCRALLGHKRMPLEGYIMEFIWRNAHHSKLLHETVSQPIHRRYIPEPLCLYQCHAERVTGIPS